MVLPTPSQVIVSLVIGLIASAYLLYGRRQSSLPVLLSGVALLVMPFVIPAMVPQILIAILLIVLPILLSRR